MRCFVAVVFLAAATSAAADPGVAASGDEARHRLATAMQASGSMSMIHFATGTSFSRPQCIGMHGAGQLLANLAGIVASDPWSDHLITVDLGGCGGMPVRDRAFDRILAEVFQRTMAPINASTPTYPTCAPAVAAAAAAALERSADDLRASVVDTRRPWRVAWTALSEPACR